MNEQCLVGPDVDVILFGKPQCFTAQRMCMLHTSLAYKTLSLQCKYIITLQREMPFKNSKSHQFVSNVSIMTDHVEVSHAPPVVHHLESLLQQVQDPKPTQACCTITYEGAM